jgi:transcriptional regulator with XRE-family HTH domain
MQTTAEDVKRELAAAVAALAKSVAGGFTQEEAGALFGVNNSTVSRWLAGSRMPAGEARQAVLRWYRQSRPATALDASADYRRGLADAADKLAALVELLRAEAHSPDPRLLAADAPMPSERDAGRGTAPAAGASPRAPRRARGL